VTGSRGRSIPQLKINRLNPEKSQFDLFPAAWLRCLTFISALVVVFLVGCGKKTISKSELRGITSEIVAAAQKATQHKSEIAIRPEIVPVGAGAGQPPVDDV
jgi:hypothetical protein